MNWKKFLPYISIIGIFLILIIGLFPDAFKGEVVKHPDILNFKGIGSDATELRKETGEIAVWTNRSFSGMPTYVWGGAPYKGNKLRPLHKWFFSLGLPSPVCYFFIAFLSFFILTIVLKIDPWIGLVGSLACGLCCYNFLNGEAGHISKFMAISYCPLIAAGVLLVYRKKYILGALLFGIGLGIDIMAGHIQMTYYFGICMAIFVIAKLIISIQRNELANFVKASAILLIPLMLAVGSNASRLWTSYEYMKETIRGPQILTTAEGDSKTGLNKEYVFDWSHGIGETVSFIVPGAFGGGSIEPMDKDFATYKDLKKKGVGRAGLKTAPLYWGDMPFTSGPIYFGAISWLLFVIGILLVRGHLKWWLLFTTVLITMLSWGKNLMGFNELFYNYFPLYDKFRSVNSILSVLQFTIPLLGVLALKELIYGDWKREELIKKMYTAVGITAGVVLLFGMFGGVFFDFHGANDARYESAGYNLAAIVSDRKMMIRNDSIRSLIFILMAGGLIWMYLKEKLFKKSSIVLGILAFLMILDLGGIGHRYLNGDHFVKAKKYADNFEPRAVDNQILQDPSPHYRVYDMSISTFNSNRASNHHNTIGGYHAAKLRRYNDLIERQIAAGNQKVMDMLNAKYYITRDQQAQQNPGALGNVWFVKNIQQVNTHDDEINSLSDFEPRETAIIHSEFDAYLNGFSGGNAEGNIQLTTIKPNHISYTSNSNSEQLAVFSEVIYKPNEKGGWQSFIDGKPADHIRANYILRAMKIPAGEHTIEFKFRPASYYVGETIALVCSMILILGCIAYAVRWKMNKAES